MRTLVDIPDDDIDTLDRIAALRGDSRAAVIRDAVKRYIAQRSGNDWIEIGAGYWKDRMEQGE